MSNKERQELIEYLEKIGEVPEWVREAVLYDFNTETLEEWENEKWNTELIKTKKNEYR